MIRIVILAIGIFILWVLFISGWARKKKVIVSLLSFTVLVAGLWWESHGKTPKSGLVELSEVVSCGSSGEHSYRSNYNIQYCLQNNSSSATLRRIGIRVSALECVNGNCKELESVTKELTVAIAPGEQANASVSLPFDDLAEGRQDLSWVVEPVFVRATR